MGQALFCSTGTLKQLHTPATTGPAETISLTSTESVSADPVAVVWIVFLGSERRLKANQMNAVIDDLG